MTIMNKNKPLISIITPVYNTEKYLPRCLDSILSQTFTDFEVLLIDDGSTDGSGKICDSYAEKDSRIRVFHKENGGVSSARNLALDSSMGEWVCFVDSDDELFQKGLQVLADGISDEVDLVMAGYKIIDQDGAITYSIDTWDSRILSVAAGAKEMFVPKDYKYQGYIGGKLFRLCVIKGKNLLFNEKIFFNEDRLFVTQFICSSSKCVFYTTMPVYGYHERRDSAMGALKESFNPKFITDLDARIMMMRIVRKEVNDKGLNSEAESLVYKGYRRTLYLMEIFNFEGKRIKRRLRRKCVKALGLRSYLSFEKVRNRRRIKNKLRKMMPK